MQGLHNAQSRLNDALGSTLDLVVLDSVSLHKSMSTQK